MSIILSLETTTNVCSVAIHQEGKLIASKENHSSQSHSRLLAVHIKSLLQELDLKAENIDAVAVSKGPGSYTGVRIGLSTAKGLCYGLSIPLIAVNTLQAMAHGMIKFIHDNNTVLCPMIDARRMEVYCLIMDSSSRILMETSPVIIDENSFSQFLENYKVLFFGNGSSKCRHTIMHPNALFIDSIYTSAVQIGEIAITSFYNKNFEDLAYFEPNYLKEFMVGKPKSK